MISQTIEEFHVEPTNICTLKCPGCARTRFIDQWPKKWKNHNLAIDQLLKFLDIDLVDKKINLCGNYGDPVYHSDLINFVKKLKQRGPRLSIVTNGSYKSREWWQELTSLLDNSDSITFSIDGTPENFINYRKNADWKSIQIGIEVSTKSKCLTVWKYIPFKYNQNDIEQVKNLSVELGIDQFEISHSDRFDEKTIEFFPDNTLLGNRYQSQQIWKSNRSITDIDPKCQLGKSENYISADGYYIPCCYLADHRFYYKNIFGKNKKQYSIQNTTLSAIREKTEVIDFYNTLPSQTGCQYNCPGANFV
jgi:MoaA/NifB/PqqE/SkfB family radical SAM enzyme